MPYRCVYLVAGELVWIRCDICVNVHLTESMREDRVALEARLKLDLNDDARRFLIALLAIGPELDGIGDRLWASWFQGVTTRTAGFNTVDIGGIHDSTAMMFMSLMVIGGGSTSTAGGIKVTTFIVLLLATVAFLKRRTQLHVFGRSLGPDEVMKVLALAMVSMLTVFVGIFLITLSNDGNFLDLAFEVTSAFGTVGLSRGATGEVDTAGRAVIVGVMFIGRVGPLTLGFCLATRTRARIDYPPSKVYLG